MAEHGKSNIPVTMCLLTASPQPFPWHSFSLLVCQAREERREDSLAKERYLQKYHLA